MLTLPVPAPTSQNTSPGRGSSRARMAARTSRLVMGASPRRNQLSGKPGTRRATPGAGSASSTLRGANRSSAKSPAVPLRTCCPG